MANKNNVERPLTCDACGQPIQGESHDIWFSQTLYDDEGEPVKTLGDMGHMLSEHDVPDYITIGECHYDRLLACWEEFVKNLIQGT